VVLTHMAMTFTQQQFSNVHHATGHFMNRREFMSAAYDTKNKTPCRGRYEGEFCNRREACVRYKAYNCSSGAIKYEELICTRSSPDYYIPILELDIFGVDPGDKVPRNRLYTA